MIVKGSSRSGPLSLAAHLGNAETNERVELLESRGTVATDLRGALVEMDAYAIGTKCEKPLYHAAVSPEPPHRLTPEQRGEAIEALEQRLGFSGHSRVVVMHQKEGREHIHVVWSRIDTEKMKAVGDSYNYRKHEAVARDLERRFGHDRVQGAHHEREGVPRPDRTPSRAELRQEERTGISGKVVKAQVSAAFRSADGPEAFKSALEDGGYLLAQGDRRDFVVIDKAGGVHSLARRLDGVRAAELREFMAPLDRNALPTVEQLTMVIDERERRAQSEEQARDLARLEKGFSSGEDYVSQTRAALKEHQARQEFLREDRRERPTPPDDDTSARDRERKAEEAEDAAAPSVGSTSYDFGDVEITDGMRERIDRLLGSSDAPSQSHSRDGPGRQPGAPGGGRTRSR